MKIFRLIIFILVLLALQTTVLELIAIRGFRPDLLLLFLLLRCSGCGKSKSVLAGFGLGLLQDLAGGGFLGVYTLSKSLTGFLLGKLFPQKLPEERWLFLGGIMICILCHDFVSLYINHQVGYIGFFMFLWRQVLPSAAYNFFAVMLLIMFPVKRRWWGADGMAD